MINIKKISAICDDKDLHEAFKENYLLLEEVVEKAGNDPERLDTATLLNKLLSCNILINVKAECQGGDLRFKREVEAGRAGSSCTKIPSYVNITQRSGRESHNPISPSR